MHVTITQLHSEQKNWHRDGQTLVECFYFAPVRGNSVEPTLTLDKLGHNAGTKSLNIYHLIYSLIYPQPLKPQMEIPKLFKKHGTSSLS